MKKIYLVIVVVITVLCFQCEKSNDGYDPIPDEIFGTWVHEDIGDEDIPLQLFKVIFSHKTAHEGFMEWYWYVDFESESKLVVAFAAKGRFFVKENTVFPNITEVGSQLSYYDDGILPEIKWYDPGDDEWIFFDMDEELKFEFEIVNGEFVQFMDENLDGDYDDEGERLVYSRQN